MFATIGIVISSFALPIVLARSMVVGILQDVTFGVAITTLQFHFQIHWGACYLTLAGNTIAYITILGYFFGYESGDSW